MAMQSNCNGPLIIIEGAKKVLCWFKEARSNLNFLALPRERNVRLTIMLSLRISCAGQTLIFGSYVGIICGKPDYNKGTYWSCQAHKLEPPHLPNPTKFGNIVHSHRLHCLIPSYWRFSIVNGIIHCALNHGTYWHLSY